MTPSLSETFEPPSTTTYGRSGSSVSRSQHLDLGGDQAARGVRQPRRRRRRREACLRCTTPKPSATNTSASAASWSANAPRSASSLLVSPGVEAEVLQQRRPRRRPGPSTAAWRRVADRVGGEGDRRAEQLAEARGDRGQASTSGPGAPLGRPRWAQTTTRAPASAQRLDASAATARIRPSSVIVPSPSSGTFRSARTSTRLPAGHPAASDGRRVPGPRSERRADERDQVDQAVGVAPLVVVPADDLDLVADDLGQAGVEDAGRRVGDDVGGDDRVLGVVQDALERALGGGLDRGVDLLDRGLAAGARRSGRWPSRSGPARAARSRRACP